MKTCLITGGNGFIGMHLTKRLLKENYRVKVFSRFRKENPLFNEIQNHTELECLKGDISDFGQIDEACEDVDIIFHLAGFIGDDILKSFKINCEGTVNILESARKNDVEKLIYSSTVSVYGRPSYLPLDEDHPLEPDSNYGLSKLIGELYCKHYLTLQGMQGYIFRLSSVYGSGQELSVPNKAIPLFMDALSTGKIIKIFGDGSQKRDYIFVEDVVEIFLKSIQRDTQIRTFNLANGTGVSPIEIYDILSRTMGRKTQILHESITDTFQTTSLVYDVDKLKRLFDFNPTSFEQGIGRMMNSFRRAA